jgi:hypothetical protein
MLITVKKPYFEPEVRNSVENLQTRFEWFMKWKDSDLDFTKNCIFIDEAGFHYQHETQLGQVEKWKKGHRKATTNQSTKTYNHWCHSLL